MEHTPIALLSTLLRFGEESFPQAGYPKETLGQLKSVGLVREAGRLQQMQCPACDEGHAAEPFHSNGRWFVACPNTSEVVDVDAETELCALDWSVLSRQIASAFGVSRGRNRRLSRTSVWAAGDTEWCGSQFVTVVVAPPAAEGDLRERLSNALAELPRPTHGLVLTSADVSAKASPCAIWAIAPIDFLGFEQGSGLTAERLKFHGLWSRPPERSPGRRRSIDRAQLQRALDVAEERFGASCPDMRIVEVFRELFPADKPVTRSSVQRIRKELALRALGA